MRVVVNWHRGGCWSARVAPLNSPDIIRRLLVITAIQQVAVNVKDVERAKVFYRDQLGIRHLFDGGPKLTFFDCGGVRLMLGTPEKPEFDHPSSILYFRVA